MKTSCWLLLASRSNYHTYASAGRLIVSKVEKKQNLTGNMIRRQQMMTEDLTYRLGVPSMEEARMLFCRYRA